MISFNLCCAAGHNFEGWFGSSADFRAQTDEGLLICPVCGNADIQKLLSAPNIGRKGNQGSSRTAEADQLQQSANAETAIVSNGATLPPVMAAIADKIADAQKKMLKDSEWVGRKFAEEARAIHYNETSPRLIHGETSPQEAEALAEEGVAVAPLLFPFIPPEVKN
ncbi:DUF1178 family protein [Sphingorhabdus arenilitoris]|uniref:DUF1178 family protein n=1 Tax=Sphingorhabdus arenilitoris TaxID=1490041 RepID=A0ABV8RG52_9SPHN